MRENRQLEFKENITSYRSLNKELVAFLNDIGGEVLIGISDSGEYVGLSEKQIESLLEEIPQAIFDGISPFCRPDISVKNVQGKQLLSVKVYPGNKKPYFIKSKGIPQGVYIRIASHSMPANHDIIEELQRSNTSVTFDQEKVSNSSIEDFDRTVLQAHYGEIPTEESLLADKVLVVDEIRKKLVATIAGTIFFHKKPNKVLSSCEVLFSKFSGNNMDDLIRTKDYSSPMVQMANEIIQDLKHELQQIDQLKDAQLISTVTILPEEALREVLNNALIHRKYFIQDAIKIALFRDRIEIFSPGNFPGPITDFYSGVSYTRNPTIRQLARNINLVEKRGLGFRKIFESCEKNGNPKPIISDSNGDFVKVILFFKNSHSALNTELWPKQLTVFNNLFEIKESFTLTQAAKLLGCSKNTAKKRLEYFVDQDMLILVGQGRAAHYEWK